MTDTRTDTLVPTMPAVGDPRWWLSRLEKQLDDRQQALDTLDAYYEGRHPLAFASEKFLKAFGGLFKAFASNWMALVVDSVEERLNVEGFRFGKPAVDNTAESDQDAWDIWQRNQLDVDSQLAHTDALVHGESAAIVWSDGDDGVEITVESAHQVVVAYKPGSRRKRAAALKKWRDDDGYLYATLYLPDEIYKFRSQRAYKTDDSAASRVQWVQRDVDNEAWPLTNPLGVVPVVPLCNRPRLLVPAQSEIASLLAVQDAVNKTVADMLVASEYVAVPQRWISGLEVKRDPETNQPIEPFRAAVDRLWQLDEESDKVGVGEFTQADLRNFVVGIEMLVQHIASQSRTPPHYFYLKGQFPSGESLKSAETGLIAKARRKMRPFGESWEETMRLAFAVLGDPRRDEVKAETIWADPESRTESEHVDAILKKQALGVPQQQLWQDLGYSPTQIERFNSMLEEQAMHQAMLTTDIFGLGPPPRPPVNGNAAPANGNTPANSAAG